MDRPGRNCIFCVSIHI